MKIDLPGDKSLSHRVLMLAAIAEGTSTIHNLTPSTDILMTKRCLEAIGIPIDQKGTTFKVHGQGGRFQEPAEPIDAGGSGTTATLFLGILAMAGIKATLVGDDSLMRRPMARVVEPLREMGSKIHISARGTLPVTVFPSVLETLDYQMPLISAQVKSALLLAGLGANGVVAVTEQVNTRDHTENLMKALGVKIKTTGTKIVIGKKRQSINPFKVTLPNDPSAAAFPAALAALSEKSKIEFKNLLLNPNRLGFFEALKNMGAEVQWKVEKNVLGEPVGQLSVRGNTLGGVAVSGAEIPTLIDEIPALAVLATQAKGDTVVRDAGELRLKESDRIKGICDNLRRLGARVQEFSDGFRVLGPVRLRGASIMTQSDDRIAMAFALAAHMSQEKTTLDDPDCVNGSFPGYYDLLKQIPA